MPSSQATTPNTWDTPEMQELQYRSCRQMQELQYSPLRHACSPGAPPQVGPFRTTSGSLSTSQIIPQSLPSACMHRKAGAHSHHSGAFLSLRIGKNGEEGREGERAARQGHAHAHRQSWQSPPRGEASTCPIPERGVGAVAPTAWQA